MSLSLAAIGAKVTAAIANAIIGMVNAQYGTLVIPTVSGAGASVSALGKITLAACSSVTISNCFSGANDNAEMIYNLGSGSATSVNVSMQLAAVGVPDTGGDYDYEIHFFNAATSSPSGLAAQTSAPMTPLAEPQLDGVIKFFGAPLSVKTRWLGAVVVNPGNAIPGLGSVGGMHRLANPYDGVKLTFSNPVSGTIRFYLLANG